MQEENSEFKSVKFPLKIDLVSHPVEVLSKYIHENIKIT